jgi:hypothetical protein
MAVEEMITSLPTVTSATLNDIIYAVQGYVSPTQLGTSVQETLQQVYTLFQSNIILFNSGNPNGAVAGSTYQFCWDTLDAILYICTTTGTASTAVWTRADINSGYTTTVTAASTTTLTALSYYWQFFTGSTTQTVVMPITSTLALGVSWSIVNNSSGTVTIQSSGGNTITTLAAGQVAIVTCILTSGTTATSWNAIVSAMGGGVTSITGTAHQVIASASTGAITLSTPQNIDTTSTPTFGGLTLTAALTPPNGGLGIATVPTNGQIPIGNGTNYTAGTLTAGTGISVVNASGSITINATTGGVTSITGTANQIIASSPTGAITLSTPQNINTTSSPTFAALTLSAPLVPGSGGLGIATTPTNGQIPIGNGTNYTAATLTAGTGISIGNGVGTVTVTATGISIGWNGVSGTTQAAAVNSGYVIQNASQTTVTLPATAAIGSIVIVTGLGAGGFILAANTGQTIKMAANTTSSGGSLTSAEQYDCVTVVCVVANTTWAVTSGITTGFTIA